MVGGERVIQQSKPLDWSRLTCAWPKDLKPGGEGSVCKEPFADWWSRNYASISHLPEDLCEQWVYRHWTYSPFTFLPIDTLQCERRIFQGEELLASVFRAFGGDLNPQFDYETFQRGGGDARHQTARALDEGTWDYPMILLKTPHGLVCCGKRQEDVRLVIVEGHQRHRYLNALHALGRPPRGPHEVFLLSSPVTD